MFAEGGDNTTNGCYRITWTDGAVYFHELIAGVWTLNFDTRSETEDPTVPVAISGFSDPSDPVELTCDNLYLNKAGSIYLYADEDDQTQDDTIRITRNVQDLCIKKRSLGAWLETFAFTRR